MATAKTHPPETAEPASTSETARRRDSDASFEEKLSGYRAATDPARSGSRSRMRDWIAFSSAATAASAMAGTAEAAIIYSGPQNLDVGPIVIGAYSDFEQVSLDLDGDSVNDVNARIFAFYYGSFLGADLRGIGTDAGIAQNGDHIRQFASGSSIGASASFAANPGALFDFSAGAFDPTLDWNATGEVGFAGVEFGGHYGWIQLEVTANNHLTVVDWAYESTPGAAIKAGATVVPEPSAAVLTGLGLLALGAEGVRRRRTRER